MLKLNKKQSTNNQSVFTSSTQLNGFTIIELLVVIVVIAILAAITIVAYTGISQKAIASALQSDLTSAQKQLKLYYVDHGSYPESIATEVDNCPTPTDARYCLKPSPGNTFSYTPSPPSYQTFTLDVTNTASTVTYRITNDTGPELVAEEDPNWIASAGGANMAGKYVYYIDAPSMYTWANRDSGCISPGRSPTKNELLDIYAYRGSYGTFQANSYWSSTEYSSPYAYYVSFYDGDGGAYYDSKAYVLFVRCGSD
jgi:prepilin-type N-terminal cleavage/methylation domain-containing protein